MEEERRDIVGYEGLYQITTSGRIFSLTKNKFHVRNGSEYGFKNVHLSKNGTRSLYQTKKLWEKAFGKDLDVSEYRGV